jgi:hypothetical protein
MENASAEAFVQGLGTILNRLDVSHRLPMTYDPGREMAQSARWSELTNIINLSPNR